MKTEHEREQLIKAINVLLHSAYDSTLDEIYALLKRIETEEDENDLRAYNAAKSDVENNSLISWEDIKKEIALVSIPQLPFTLTISNLVETYLQQRQQQAQEVRKMNFEFGNSVSHCFSPYI
ncbi:hypothetical protein [Iningainema tapete]|uniref:hypothetical protein n=1 Tax=Iningainema tapete TaxID=2806730 RepID=UPI00307FF175